MEKGRRFKQRVATILVNTFKGKERNTLANKKRLSKKTD